MTGNNIADVLGVGGLKSLRVLRVGFNVIADGLRMLAMLKPLSLQVLDCFGNPFSRQDVCCFVSSMRDFRLISRFRLAPAGLHAALPSSCCR